MKTVLHFFPDKYVFITSWKISFEFKSSWNLPSFRLKSGGLRKSTATLPTPDYIPHCRMFKSI